ncbi:phosphatidylinositol N-acetylglucosaminyltransferase subunit H-like [Cylas formicarius]|uniref:phosphatidylinositol N-acetylglucosaminyltransferase subunit H-like n=1 Tax=Cylas formicarius TaxID=197179 RepID=UPI0029583240|nr:phosphatidylinositol N-acetylglucosaminyltransferase subunit H-like [Cylas formicarius]
MVKAKRKGTHFKSISGKHLILVTKRTENSINISVKYTDNLFFYRYIVILAIMVMCNITCFLFNIFFSIVNIVVFTVCIGKIYQLCHRVQEENLVVIRKLGFQITAKYSLGKIATYIPYEKVQKIFINEVIARHRVKYILTLLTKDSDNVFKLVPLFRDTEPRLACLKIIYRSLVLLKNNQPENS